MGDAENSLSGVERTEEDLHVGEREVPDPLTCETRAIWPPGDIHFPPVCCRVPEQYLLCCVSVSMFFFCPPFLQSEPYCGLWNFQSSSLVEGIPVLTYILPSQPPAALCLPRLASLSHQCRSAMLDASLAVKSPFYPTSPLSSASLSTVMYS